MEFYATTFDNVHDVMRRNDCIEGMSARLAGIETYLVTDYMIGDAAVIGGGQCLRQPRFRALGSGELLSLEANDAVRRHGEHTIPCHNNTSYIEVGQTAVQTLPRGSLVP